MALAQRRALKMGRGPDRPAKILATINRINFGEFATGLLLVNYAAHRFDHSLVTILYRGDAPFKSDLVRLLPGAIGLKCAPDARLPSFDLIDPEIRRAKFLEPALHQWIREGMCAQDIVLPTVGHSDILCMLDTVVPLRFSADDAEICAQELLRMGLDPHRWFCTIHGRESEKSQSSKAFRDAVPGTFQELAAHIIQRLGGQVVRLGHPGMSSFTPMDGLIDLSPIPENALLQAFAISRSRFFFGSPSGPSSLADAFLIPNAITSAVDYVTCNDNLVMRTIDLLTPDGRTLRQRELFDEGFESERILEVLQSNTGYEAFKNDLPEMVRLANFIYEMTTDPRGWREPAPLLTGPRSNQFSWPPGPPLERGHFLPV